MTQKPDVISQEVANDLLNVLEEAREYIAYSAPQWHRRTQQLVAKVDAAISKAKGE